MQKYRVECNFGYRYFDDIIKVRKYFNKCIVRHLDAEMWFVMVIAIKQDGFVQCSGL